jgi:hypothetical protein
MSPPRELSDGAARLRDAFDDLAAAWIATQPAWNDDVSRRFAEQHLDPLGPVFKAAVDAATRMSLVVQQMVRDCER